MPRSIDPRSYEPPEGERPVITPPVELKRRSHDPYAAFRFGGFSLFTSGNLLSITGRLMLAVAVEWELYARTRSATALGLVGLVIAVPVVALSLPAGHLADRISRKRIILVSQIFSALASVALAIVSCSRLCICLMHFSRFSFFFWFFRFGAAPKSESRPRKALGKVSSLESGSCFAER